AAERGQEPDRGSGEGRGVRIPRLRLSLAAGRLAAGGNAADKAADSTAAKNAGGVRALALTNNGAGDRDDQTDSAGMGAVLPRRELESVFGLREALGRAAGAAPSDEGEGPTGLGLEEVEYGVALQRARAVPGLPCPLLGPARTRSQLIGPITLDAKRTGKRRTGKPFAPFDVAGAGDGSHDT